MGICIYEPKENKRCYCYAPYRLLDAFAKAQDMDFYILPSSVHDVLLVPAKNDGNISDSRRMVRDINRDIVEPEERLSDEVYYFRRSTGTVKLIPE